MLVRQRVIAAAITGWAAKAIALAVGFFLTPFILHRLGDVTYGLFILVGSTIAQGSLLDIGIRPAVLKYVSEYHAKRDYESANSLIATALFLYSILGLVAFLLAVAIAPFFHLFFNVPQALQSTAIKLVVLMGIQLGILFPLSIFGAVLWAVHEYRVVNGISAISTLATAAGTIGVLLVGGGVTAIIEISICISIVAQMIMLLFIHRLAPNFRFGLRPRRELVRPLLSFSGSMFVIDFAYNLQTKIDEIVVGIFMPISAVGAYSIARRLSGIPQLIAEQGLGAFVPLSSQLQAEGNLDSLQLLYLTGTRITLAISVPLAGVLILLGRQILTIWVSAEYAAYAPIVVVLALASLAEVSQWAGGSILQGMARHHGLAVASICAAVLNLGLSLLLVRSYGLIGVAIGTLVPTIVVNFGYMLMYMMHIIRVTSSDLVKQVLVPVLVPVPGMVSVILITEWIANSVDLLTVGLAAAAGVTAYGLVYGSICAGNAERELLQRSWTKLREIASFERSDN